MKLNKEQTYELLANSRKMRCRKINKKFVVRIKWQCLHCLKDIYVNFEATTIQSSIFCKPCYNLTSQISTIAQLHYLNNLKREQLKFVSMIRIYSIGDTK